MGKARRQNKRKQRIKLWEKDPHCCYCGCLTQLPPYGNKVPMLDDYATIEHIYTRFDAERRSPNHNGEQRHFLACNRCNQEKGRERERMIGIEEIRRRSGRFPKKLDIKPKPWYIKVCEFLTSLFYDNQ